MTPKTINVTRQDIINGDVPVQAAHFCANNAPLVITTAGQTTCYTPAEWCQGAFHPDSLGHPWREVDGVPVPRSARIGFAQMDEHLRELEAEGVGREDALRAVCERFPDTGHFTEASD